MTNDELREMNLKDHLSDEEVIKVKEICKLFNAQKVWITTRKEVKDGSKAGTENKKSI